MNGPGDPDQVLRLVVDTPAGLHARPAARFVETCAPFAVSVEIVNLTTGAGPASGSSLIGLATLGVQRGHEIEVVVRGVDAVELVAALRALAERRFDESDASSTDPVGMALPLLAAPVGDGALRGLPASPGQAAGPARRLRRVQRSGGPRVQGTPVEERQALHGGLTATREEIRATYEMLAAQAGPEHAAILGAQLLLLDDDALIRPASAAIAAGVLAEQAWDDAVAAAVAAYESLPEAYQRARASDVREVGRQVRGRIAGSAGPPVLRGEGILVANDLGPFETAALDIAAVRGIATAVGGPTSHSAILARALGVPAVVGLGNRVLTIPEETELLLDGDAGTVIIDPSPAQIAAHRERGQASAAIARSAHATREEPATTLDGVRVVVSANISMPEDSQRAVAEGADGIGLLRTELLLAGRATAPSAGEHEAVYRAALEPMGARPATLRTLDAGGDKPLPWIEHPPEANPALGVRGVRLALADPTLAVAQLQAVLRIAAERPLRLMFPMVATLGEWRAVCAQLDSAVAALGWAARPADLQVGVMIEVPAAALCADVLAAEADFLSIGTNDLAQYTLAADRGSAAVGHLADPVHPAVLRLIAEVCAAGRRHECPVSVCGEAASDPVAIALLLGLGVRELSVAPPLVAVTKAAVRMVDLRRAVERSTRALDCSDAGAVRELPPA